MRGATRCTRQGRQDTEDFNPRSSCEERPCKAASQFRKRKFQSTLLMRGATQHVLGPVFFTYHFNPRSSCEERLSYTRSRTSGKRFQSTLLMRGATSDYASYCLEMAFQSTLLMRGATGMLRGWLSGAGISIHAPHARSDEDRPARRHPHGYFNPRSSCEERPEDVGEGVWDTDFNPRSSCEERPTVSSRWFTLTISFQSTLLMRGATRREKRWSRTPEFQSTLLMRGATIVLACLEAGD